MKTGEGKGISILRQWKLIGLGCLFCIINELAGAVSDQDDTGISFTLYPDERRERMYRFMQES